MGGCGAWIRMYEYMGQCVSVLTFQTLYLFIQFHECGGGEFLCTPSNPPWLQALQTGASLSVLGMTTKEAVITT